MERSQEMEMELMPYFYKRKLIDTHSDYGIVAKGIEKCPIGKVKLIGVACIRQDCCKGRQHFMHIVEGEGSWIKCEATTKMMDEDPSLGQINTCVIS